MFDWIFARRFKFLDGLQWGEAREYFSAAPFLLQFSVTVNKRAEIGSSYLIPHSHVTRKELIPSVLAMNREK